MTSAVPDLAIKNATDIVQLILRDIISTGDSVVDATCGNGHDSVFLASLVGPSGRLVCIDIQPEAIEKARRRLSEVSDCPETNVILGSHADIRSWVPQEESISAVVYDLGYLPGAVKSPGGERPIVTRAESTIEPIGQALGLLMIRGVILIAVCTGHLGGQEKADALYSFLLTLEEKRLSVARHQWHNQPSNLPLVLIIQRQS